MYNKKIIKNLQLSKIKIPQLHKDYYEYYNLTYFFKQFIYFYKKLSKNIKA